MDKEAYRKYLQTAVWRVQRNRALKRANYCCQQCPSTRDLQVHHRTYERLGAEWDEDDLEVLCAACHRGETAQQMHDAPHSRVYLKLASDVLKDRPFHSFADLAAEVKERCISLRIPIDVAAIDKALSVLSGSSRVTPPPAQTVADVRERTAEGREISHSEAVEFLTRLGLARMIKIISSVRAEIDIYGPEPREENWGDHDRY